MNTKLIATAAFLAMGLSTSLGYKSLAQQTPSTVNGNQPAVNSNRTNTRVSATDRQFITKAAQAGIAEVTLGQLAMARAVTPEVKAYGQHLVNDHTQANSQLMNLAAQKGITLPTQMDAKHKALRARLGQIPGRRFDETFVREMARDHQVVISMFQLHSQRGQDPDIRAFAANNLPTLREHWQVARTLTGSVARGDSNNRNNTNNQNQ